MWRAGSRHSQERLTFETLKITFKSTHSSQSSLLRVGSGCPYISDFALHTFNLDYNNGINRIVLDWHSIVTFSWHLWLCHIWNQEHGGITFTALDCYTLTSGPCILFPRLHPQFKVVSVFPFSSRSTKVQVFVFWILACFYYLEHEHDQYHHYHGYDQWITELGYLLFGTLPASLLVSPSNTFQGEQQHRLHHHFLHGHAIMQPSLSKMIDNPNFTALAS